MCFHARKGCLRPTTDFETLRKGPKLLFQFLKDKISSMNEYKDFHNANHSSCELKHMVGVFVQSLRSVDSLKLPIRAWKHIRDASFWECLGGICGELDVVGHKFAASFWPKTAEKTWFLWKLRFSQTFYFYHSFWNTRYIIQETSLPPRGPICWGPLCRGPICRGPICRGPICCQGAQFAKQWQIGPQKVRGPICHQIGEGPDFPRTI